MQHEKKHGDPIFLLHYFNVLCNCAKFNKKGITLICRTISYCWLSTCAASNGNKQGLMTNEVEQGEVMKVCILTHEGSVVWALSLRSERSGFKTCSHRSLNLVLVIPGSTSQLHLHKQQTGLLLANWESCS